MSYITNIEANIKGAFRHEMKRKTLITGANRSGKTRITEALSLALTGLPHTTRLTKYDTEVMALKPLRAEKLWATATLSNGCVATYSLQGSTASASAKNLTLTTHLGIASTQRAGEIISDLVNTLLSGDSKRLVHAILRGYGPQTPKVELLAECPAQLRRKLSTFLPEEDELSPTKLLEVMEFMDKTLYALRAEKRGYTGAIAQLESDALTEEEITYLGLMQAALNGRGIHLVALEKMNARIEMFKNEAAHLTKIITAKSAPMVRTNIALFDATAKTLDSVLELAKISGASSCTCPVCQEPNIASERFIKTREIVTAGLDFYADDHKVLQRIDECKAEVLHITAQRDQLAQAGYGELGETETDVREAVEDLMGRKATTDRIVELSRREESASFDIESLAALTASLRKRLREDLTFAQPRFVRAANEVTPPDWEVDLVTQAGRRDVCHILLTAPNAIPYLSGALSGAEFTVLMVAVAHALAKNSTAMAKVLVIDDVWLDAAQLENMVIAVDLMLNKEVPAIDQVVLCSVSSNVSVGDDWQVIAL